MTVLKQRLYEQAKKIEVNKRKAKRDRQVGKNGRGGKSRTVSEKRNEVVDHKTGKKIKYKDYERGFIEKLQ